MLPRRIVHTPTIVPFTGYNDCPTGTLLFGGSPNFQKKIATTYTHIKVITLTQHCNMKVISNKVPLVLINTAYIGHAVYEKIKYKIKNMDIKVAYINGGKQNG